MNLLRKSAIAVLATLAVQGALAQTTQAPKATEQQRLDSIWYAATERMSQQVNLWYDHGEYLPAIQLLRMVMAIFPYDFDSASLLGWLQESTEDQAGALATYVDFRRNNPGDPDGPYLEAFYYFQKKLYAKIPPLLEPTMKMSPHPHPNTYRELAHSYERLNMVADAKRVWQSYLAIDPSDPAARTNLDRINKKLQGKIPMEYSQGKRRKA
jgi:tetratricopeptide (TPR) repeat protein